MWHYDYDYDEEEEVTVVIIILPRTQKVIMIIESGRMFEQVVVTCFIV
jgi:hypothetical protein